MIYRFEDCELDTERFELRRGGTAVGIEPQVLELLRFFVENPDRLVSREELFETVWKGRIVSDATLSSRIKAARQAIGDDGRAQAVIRTVHGRGFRFMAPIVAGAAEPAPATPAPAVGGLLEAGRGALSCGNWEEAYSQLWQAQVGGALAADDMEMLAEAAWWTSRLDERLQLLERAYELHMREGRETRAALASMLLAEQHGYMGAQSVASGWLRRAERMLQPHPNSIEHGYLVRLQGRLAFEREGNFDRAVALAEQAYALGVRFRDRDLEMVTLLDQGAALVAKGELEPGFALMDEASAAAMGGELGAMATGRIYCNMLDMCMRLGDYRRAVEWDQEAERWCSRVGHSSGFPGVCRVRRAEIRRLTGAWPEAETEARRACVELEKLRSFAAPAFYELGELSLGRGELDAAETAFRRAHELGREPQPGLARLRLAEGNRDAARALMGQALGVPGGNRLERARILPAGVEIALAAGDTDGAQAAAQELRDIAAAFGMDSLRAAALGADGTLALSQGDAQGAAARLREACRLWQENGLPFEEARARLQLGAAYRRLGVGDIAGMEIAASAAVFKRLGASLELRRAAALADGGEPD